MWNRNSKFLSVRYCYNRCFLLTLDGIRQGSGEGWSEHQTGDGRKFFHNEATDWDGELCVVMVTYIIGTYIHLQCGHIDYICIYVIHYIATCECKSNLRKVCLPVSTTILLNLLPAGYRCISMGKA